MFGRFSQRLGTGISYLASLLDVLLTSPADQEFLRYDSASGKWKNTKNLGTPSGGDLSNCTGYTYGNLAGSVPTWNQNTTGSSASCTGNAATATTAGNLSGTPAVPNGTTATTQSFGDNSTKLATTAYADRMRDAEISTSTTLVLADRGKTVTSNAGTVTVPPNSLVAFPVGTRVDVLNTATTFSSTSYVTIAGGVGVSVHFPKNLVNPYLISSGKATLIKTATNTWYATGDIVDYAF